MPHDRSLSYCAQQVRDHDPDRFLCMLFAPAHVRERLAALYAFDIELARVPGVVSAPVTGMIRYQWWRDALTELESGRPRAHPVVEALFELVRTGSLSTAELGELVDAREPEIDEEGPATLADLEAHLAATGGRLEALALQMLGTKGEGARDAARALGLAAGLTRILRTIPTQARSGRLSLPTELLVREKVRRDAIGGASTPAGLLRVVEEIAAQAMQHASAARDARRRLAPESRAPALLADVAGHHLGRLRRAGHDPFHPSVARRGAMLPLRLLLAHLTGA